jgi:thiol-disulfide isomerase/thioredoxin
MTQETPSPKISAWKRWLAGLVIVVMVVAIWLAEHPTEIFQRKPLPVINLTTLEGEPFTLQDWQGPMVVNFFASWCSPCLRELPQLERLAEHAPVYGVAWQDSPEKLIPWLKEHNAPFTEVGLENGTELLWTLRINGIPTTIVLDRSHRIVHLHEGVITDEDIADFLPAIYDHQ